MAEQKFCPFTGKRCQEEKCMAWHNAGDLEGWCKLIPPSVGGW